MKIYTGYFLAFEIAKVSTMCPEFWIKHFRRGSYVMQYHLVAIVTREDYFRNYFINYVIIEISRGKLSTRRHCALHNGIICQSAVNNSRESLSFGNFFFPPFSFRGHAGWVKPDKWTVEDILPRMESILDSVCPAEHGIIVTCVLESNRKSDGIDVLLY